MLIDSQGCEIKKDEIDHYDSIVFYGASTRNKSIMENLDITDKVLYFIDGDSSKAGTELDGYKIYKRDILLELNKDNCIIISALSEHAGEIKNMLCEYHIKNMCFYIQERFEDYEVEKINRTTQLNSRDYKYVHIIPNLMFLYPLYNMILDKFIMNEHLFVINYNHKDFAGVLNFAKECTTNNILVFDDIHIVEGIEYEPKVNIVFKNTWMKNIWKNCKKIILHSAFLNETSQRYLYSIMKDYGNKTSWIVWGADEAYGKKSNEYKNVIQYIGTTYAYAARINTIKNSYGADAVQTNATYNYIDININEKSVVYRDEGINVLLGHSAFEYDAHEEGFEYIEKFKEENMRIYCPLSYGNKEYADNIVKLGKEIFGEKFIPIFSFMEGKEYYNFLNRMDMAIMPLTKQAAGTTLKYMSSCGKKIYLRKELIKKFEIIPSIAKVAVDIENIKDESYEEFISSKKLSKEEILINLDRENQIITDAWKKILIC